MAVETVVVTGAAGRIGSCLRAGWRSRFRLLRLVDHRDLGAAAAAEEVVQLDLCDFGGVEEAMRGVEVVVHLAAIPSEDEFERLLEANVRATYNVFEAARRAGVGRVVFASTNHVTGFYPRAQTIGPADPVRPDSLYAVTKVFGEALGRLYADKWGLEMVCIRIGSFAERPTGAHAFGMWLSPRDAVQLFTKAATVPDVGYLIVYGLSANHPSWWTNPGAAVLGYQPVDDAEAAADERVREEADASPELLQGGTYTRRSFWIEP